MSTRTCIICEKELSVDKFRKNGKRYRARCKNCDSRMPKITEEQLQEVKSRIWRGDPCDLIAHESKISFRLVQKIFREVNM